MINKTVLIKATPMEVWQALTWPPMMKKWMSDLEIDINTDWEIHSAITIQGQEPTGKKGFTNNGIVLKFKPGHVLQYSHLSSLSDLADVPENYTLIEFKLAPDDNYTIVNLTLENFPTEAIYKHIDYYWTVTLDVLKQQLEYVSP